MYLLRCGHAAGRAALLTAGLFLAACGREEPAPAETAPEPPAGATARVDAQRIGNADAEPGSWLSHGRSYSEQRYSPLRQIDEDNVAGLGLAWYLDLDTSRGQQATPIVVDGVMYSTSAWSKVQAIDAKSGELLWQYDPEVPPEWDLKACCGVLPDLRWSPMLATAASFRAVVIDGALADKGMMSFAPNLNEAEVEALRAFVVSRAHESM